MNSIDRRALFGLLAAWATRPAAASAEMPPMLPLAKLPGAIAAPDFVLTDLGGRPHRLSEHRGRPVLVNFWAVWCGPCRRELGALADLRADLRADGIDVLAVNLGDSTERIVAFLADHPARDLTILLDRDKSVAAAWHVQGLPVTFAVDRAGILRFGALGERDWRAVEVKRQLRSLI